MGVTHGFNECNRHDTMYERSCLPPKVNRLVGIQISPAPLRWRAGERVPPRRLHSAQPASDPNTIHIASYYGVCVVSDSLSAVAGQDGSQSDP